MRYDFTCPNGHMFEVQLRMDDRNEPQMCETCGEQAIRQFSQGMAFIWGGRWADSGWLNGPDGFDDGLGPIRE